MSPFDINPESKIASNGKIRAELKDPEGRIFSRRAIKWGPKGEEHVNWLVMELDGVRTYIQGDNIIVTKENLRP